MDGAVGYIVTISVRIIMIIAAIMRSGTEP